jgi:hypothetical protein
MCVTPDGFHDGLACPRIPDTDSLVMRACHDVCSIGREHNRPDPIRVTPDEVYDSYACPRIPYTDSLVIRA